MPESRERDIKLATPNPKDYLFQDPTNQKQYLLSDRVLDAVKELLPADFTIGLDNLEKKLQATGLQAIDCGSTWMITARGATTSENPIRAFQTIEVPKSGLVGKWVPVVTAHAIFAIPITESTSFQSGDAPDPVQLLLKAVHGETESIGIPLPLNEPLVYLPHNSVLRTIPMGEPETHAVVFQSEVPSLLLRIVHEFSHASGIPFMLAIPTEEFAD